MPLGSPDGNHRIGSDAFLIISFDRIPQVVAGHKDVRVIHEYFVET